MKPDTFLDRQTSGFPTSLGEVALPILYRDASAVYAFFRVDVLRAAEVMPEPALVPARFAGGTAIAGVAAFDYRDSTAGPYREVGTALAVIPRDVRAPTLPLLHLLRTPAHEDVGWLVLDLPVTTAIADAGGRELWGFPKFVTGIDVEVGDDAVHAVVRAPASEEPILSLQGRAGPGVPLGAPDLAFYSVRGGQLLRTLVEGRGRMHTGLGRWLTLHVGGADHPMAHRLETLGLDGARPFAAQVCQRYQAVLHPGTPFHGGFAARAA